jgi:hypothetical protein
MTRLFAAIVLVLAFATAASAWYRHSDGYYYNSYAYNAQPYTLGSYHAGYWSCGIYYPGYYDYVPYYAPTAYVAPAAPSLEDNIGAALKIKATYEGKATLLRAAGLTLTKEELFAYSPMGQVGPYGPYSANYYRTVTPVSASTVNAQASIFGDAFNLRELGLLEAQSVERADNFASKRHSLFSSNITLATSGAVEVAKIQAKGQAAVAFLNALNNPGVVTTTGITYSGSIGQYPQINTSGATTATKQDILKAWVAAARADGCTACHLRAALPAGATVAGGFDLDDYPAMSQAERERRVYPRIDPSAADNFRMPRKQRLTADGKVDANDVKGVPGTPMSPQNLSLWQIVSVPAESLRAPAVETK